ncbi:hypothetical protein GTID1_12965 [Geobacillus thermodenitrificans]|nr:hypothetical protein GTID1_12965 [Geobacillus thermodenitrificans]
MHNPSFPFIVSRLAAIICPSQTLALGEKWTDEMQTKPCRNDGLSFNGNMPPRKEFIVHHFCHSPSTSVKVINKKRLFPRLKEKRRCSFRFTLENAAETGRTCREKAA